MKNHKGIFINLHEQNDKQILDRLNNVSNKQGYIKAVVKNDALIYKQYEKGEKDNG